MAKFENQEGRGRIFRAKERKSDKHPHFTGNAKWKGEDIQISGWANLEEGKLQSISLQIQEPRAGGSGSSSSIHEEEW